MQGYFLFWMFFVVFFLFLLYGADSVFEMIDKMPCHSKYFTLCMFASFPKTIS